MIDFTKAAENLKEVFGVGLDRRVEEAARKYSRGHFVSRIYDDRRGKWVDGNDDRGRWDELIEEDRFLPIQWDGKTISSSISQPSLVFAMIQHLDLKPGQRVLEIGAASGWSAALMSELVGPDGEVVSVEIDDELVQLAEANVKANKLTNVRILRGDGLSAVTRERPFDRIVYTVGARDFPKSLLDTITEGGRVVLVHKIDATADILYAGLKRVGRLELDPIIPVVFVELRGELEGRDNFFEISSLSKINHRLPFWGDVSGYVDLLYRTAGLRFFLRMYAPNYSLVRHGDVTGFGLLGENPAYVLQGTNIVQGSNQSVDKFFDLVQNWVKWGMPGLTGFRLSISPLGEGFGSAYRLEGKELLYEYIKINPLNPGQNESGQDALPLPAVAR